MAIAHDASSQSFSSVTSPITIAHTCTGTNLALVTYITILATGNGTTCSGVTYNGVSMTQLQTATAGTTQRMYIFGLLNPATGTNNVIVTLNNNTAAQVDILNESYTGVKQSGFPDASDIRSDGTGTLSSFSASVLTIASNAVILGASEFGNGSNPLAGDAGTVKRSEDGNNTMTNFENSGPLTPLSPGVHSLTSSVVSANNTIFGIISLAPVASVTSLPFRSLMGVGI